MGFNSGFKGLRASQHKAEGHPLCRGILSDRFMHYTWNHKVLEIIPRKSLWEERRGSGIWQYVFIVFTITIIIIIIIIIIITG